jgi:hypothetical protein
LPVALGHDGAVAALVLKLSPGRLTKTLDLLSTQKPLEENETVSRVGHGLL